MIWSKKLLLAYLKADNEIEKNIIQKTQAALNDMKTITKFQKSQIDFVQKRILTSPLDCDLGYDADTGETM